MATITANVGAAGNWTSGTSWIGGSAPTAGDDAVIPLATTSITIDAGAVCRSADFNTFTGTITMGATGTLTIGDATAGASNIAIRLPSGATFAPNSASTISFISTSSTQQTVSIDSGYTCGNITFNSASNGNYAITANLTVNSASALTFTKGTLHIDGASDNSGLTHSWGVFSSNNSNTRVLAPGTANVTLTTSSNNGINFGVITGLTINSNTATWTLSGTSNIDASTSHWYNLILSGNGANIIASAIKIDNNLTRTGGASKTNILQLNQSITVTGTFTCNSNSAVNRVLIKSNNTGGARTISAATVVISNIVDFQDITGAGAATWTVAGTGATALGDCGGNSGITFTTGATQTWSGTSGGNWSANAWTTRVPLPQDDVVINAAFSASQTVTNDMPRIGKSVDWSGTTGNPTWAIGSQAPTLYGSLTLISGMTVTGTVVTTLSGRGSSYNITSNGGSLGSNSLTIDAVGGTYSMQDALTFTSNNGDVGLTNGIFTTNSFNITCRKAFFNGSGSARTANLGTSIITLTRTSGLLIDNTSAGLTWNGTQATFVINGGTAGTYTINGGGLTYGTLTYTSAGSTNELDITGSNTFNTVNFSDVTNARSLKFTAGTTTTVTNFNINGTGSKLMTIDSITAATHTLSKTTGIVACNFLSVKNSIAQGGAVWFAGYDSTNVSGNTGWIFTSYARGLSALGTG